MIDIKTKQLFVKWSFTGGGGLREVVAMRELTVVGGRASLAKLAGWLRMESPLSFWRSFYAAGYPSFFLLLLLLFFY